MSKSVLAVIIGENISSRRKKLKLSQKELAVKLGISYEAMCRIENGNSSPKITRIQEIAEHLDCTIGALFQENSDRNNNAQERAEIIGGLLGTISEESQEAVMSIVYASVKAFKKK